MKAKTLGISLMITLGTILAATTPILLLLPQQGEAVIERKATEQKSNSGDAPMATSGDNVYVVWNSNKTGNWEIMFRASTDGGKTFDDKINISNSSNGRSDMQNIAASGNNVYVIWCDDKTGDMEIYMRKSTDNGKTFGKNTIIKSVGTLPTNIKNMAYSQQETDSIPINTRIALSGNNTYTSWWDNKTGNWEVLYARSTDGGETFDDAINISNSSIKHSARSQLAANGNNVYLTWWEDPAREPMFRASNDNGASFGSILKLSANGTIGSSGAAGREG
jgi:hypothetical protein